MISSKQESVLLKKIKSLTELEFASLLDELVDHMAKNHWLHLADAAFDVEDWQGQVNFLEDELEEVKDELSEKESAMQRALNILESIEQLDDDIQKEIDKAIDELS